MKADDRDHSKRFKVSMILKRRIRAISNSIPYPQLSMAPLKGLFLDGSMLRGAKLLISKSFLPNMISFEQDFSQSNSVDRSTAWQNITPIPIRIAPNLVTAGPTNSTHSQRNICFCKDIPGFLSTTDHIFKRSSCKRYTVCFQIKSNQAPYVGRALVSPSWSSTRGAPKERKCTLITPSLST
jgi:hypothetical protein